MTIVASVNQVRYRSRENVSRIVFVAAALVSLGLPTYASDQLKSRIEERVRHATVFVRTFQSKREKADTYLGAGSGYFINSTGLMVSNNHVVDPTHDPFDTKNPQEKQRFHYEGGKLSWTVTTDSGTGEEKTYDAVVVYQNEQADQAIMQVYDKEGRMLRTPNYLRLQPESRLRKRMNAWGVGFPGAESQGTRSKAPAAQVDPGNILELPRSPGGRIRKVYTDVLVRPGNSGGPQVDQDGLVVGTATLMQPPKGREDTGGARYTALVPAALTAEMVRNAFKLGKIPPQTDFTPFMDFLAEQSGRVDLPEFDRRTDREVLFYTNGDRVYGRFIPTKLALETELGKIELPIHAIAYIMNNDDGTGIYLDGGNRINVPKLDASFEFEPDGGKKIEVKYADVAVISFRTSDRKFEPVSGKVIVIDGNLCRLILSDIEGASKFTGAAGTVEIKLDEIDRIETSSGGDRVIVFRDERRMTGKFEPTPFRATIAAAKTPIELQLSSLESGYVEARFLTGRELGGLGLAEIAGTSRTDFKRIAQALESNDPGSAKPMLDKVLDKSVYGKLPTLEKEQAKLLEAVSLLRTDKFAEAQKAFRSVSRSEDLSISTYANACAEVLKRYESGKYEGKPLSDRAAFAEAGAELAKEYVRQSRDALKELRRVEGDKKNDYRKIVNAVSTAEKSIPLAGVFLGTGAEDLMLRLWKIAFSSSVREYYRLEEEMKELRENKNTGPGRPARPQAAVQREVNEMMTKRDEALKIAVEYILKRYDYGFFIEDQDIEELRAASEEQD